RREGQPGRADPRGASDCGSLGLTVPEWLPRTVSVLPLHGLGRPMGVAAVPPATTTGTASATARSAPTARPAATTATGSGGLRIRDLHRDPPAIELAPVQLRNRGLGLLRRVHLDDPDSPGLPGKTIGDHGRGQNVSALCEELPEPFAGRGVRKTAYVEVRCHRNPLGLSSALLHAPRTRKVLSSEARPAQSGGRSQCTQAEATRNCRGGLAPRVTP